MAALVTHVSLRDDVGNVVSFGPGDDVPEWAQRRITNPRVWEGGEAPFPAGGEDDDDAGDGPPPKSGKGSGVRAWRKYAADNGVDVEGLSEPETIWAALEARGVPTEREDPPGE